MVARWRCWSGRDAPRSRCCAVGSPAPESRSRWRATRPRWSGSPPYARCSTRCAPWSTSTTTTPTTPTTSTRSRPRACWSRRSPGLDATDVRALPGRCASATSSWPLDEGRTPRPSPELLREAVLDGAAARRAATGEAAVVRRVAALAAAARHRARALLDAGGTVEEVLWVLWSGTGWPESLRAACSAAVRGARLAHRDLDARVRAVRDRRPGRGAARPHQRRELPGHPGRRRRSRPTPSPTAASAARPCGCSPPTGPRASSGDLVVVAHVQEGAWPDLRRRATLLQADRIGAERYAVPVLQPDTTTRELLAEERRLFYVACTRARERLVVTAVASPDDEGEQPSRFLTELGVDGTPPSRAGRRARCRCPGWSASCGVRPPTPTRLRRCARSPSSGSPGWPRSRAPTAGRSCCGGPPRRGGHRSQ